MTIRCPADKIRRLQDICRKAVASGIVTVHDCERMLGLMESVRPVTPHAALHYRSVQRQLLRAKFPVRRPGQIIHLSKKSILNLQWWISPAGFAGNSTAPIREPSPTVDIFTDANMERGGAHNSRGQFHQRSWSEAESETAHINLLETRAAREGVSVLAEPGDRVRLHIDNTTACAYIRRQGGTKSYSLSQEACMLWEEAAALNITLLTPQWIGTRDNVQADFLSRHSLDHWEVCLDPTVFNFVMETFALQPTLDAFASRQTAQVHVLACRQPGSVEGCTAGPLGPGHLLVPAYPHHPQGDPETQGGPHQSNSHLPTLANLPVVAPVGRDVGGAAPCTAPLPPGSQLPGGGGNRPLHGSSGSTSPPGRALGKDNTLDDDDVEFLSHHLAPGTTAGYNCVFKKFKTFCSEFDVDPCTCSPEIIVNYIRRLFNNGAEYMTVNHHRSAIAKFHRGFGGESIGTHTLVKQAVKSVFRLRPPLPKYRATFDIVPVLQYLSNQSNQHLNLKQLTLKALLLTIYSTLSRVSSLSRLGPEVTRHRDHIILHLRHLEKQGRPGAVRGFLTVQFFEEDPSLCPATAILDYLNKVWFGDFVLIQTDSYFCRFLAYDQTRVHFSSVLSTLTTQCPPKPCLAGSRS